MNPLILVLGLFIVGTIISLPVAAIFDARQFTPAQWEQVGHNRSTWITLLVVGIIPFGLVGAAFAIEYLRTIRPKLVNAPG